MASLKSSIAAAIMTKLDNVAALKLKAFDRVRLSAADFQDHDLPAVQLIDVGETIEHERARAKKTWQISLELIMKPNEFGEISQEDLWDLQYDVERALWANPNLGVAGVIHLRYIGSQTDLHLLDPYYIARLDFECLYYEALVDEC
jgi:hypothetical protein